MQTFPRGLDIAVIENGPTDGNPVGHTAIAITGQGVYSSGNLTDPGSSLLDYLKREAPRRNTTVSVIKTTPQQDAAALAYLQKTYKRIGLPYTYGNCSDISNGALNAAGIGNTVTPDFWPGSAGARAAATGAPSYSVPKLSTVFPTALDQFNPKR